MDMARILGGYIGTKFDDFTILPGLPDDDNLVPDSVDTSCDIAGVHLRVPFFTAAMRSITGIKIARAAGNFGAMAVAPRSLSTEEEVEIVSHVKKHKVKVGEIESETKPITVFQDETLGEARAKAKKYGHTNIPVITRQAELVGMFSYRQMEHDRLSPGTPITKTMVPLRTETRYSFPIATETMKDEEIKDFLREGNYRFAPVIDSAGRLSRLVFLQMEDAYKVGAAIDTHDVWEDRCCALVNAGADMIFIDTSDAHKSFSRNVVMKYKKMFPNGPPICAGNIVTPEGFLYLAEALADVIKIGMGPGSICLTNEVISAGAPSFSAVVRVCRQRDKYHKEKGRYVPLIADGGIQSTHDIPVALTHSDGVMMGKMMGWFDESVGRKVFDGDRVVGVEIFGEASPEAYEKVGDMHRYTEGDNGVAVFQGRSMVLPYKGLFKPGAEIYKQVLQEQLYHSGCRNLEQFREMAVLERNVLKQNEIKG